MELVKTFIFEHKFYLIIWGLVAGIGIWKSNELLFQLFCIAGFVLIAGIMLSIGSYIWSKENGKRFLLGAFIVYIAVSLIYALFIAKPEYIPSALEEYYNQMQERSKRF